jgi:hypothetical protein
VLADGRASVLTGRDCSERDGNVSGMGRFLLVGVPRSGTSWTGSALGRAAGVHYVDEPDGFRDPFAFRVMLQLGENPELEPGQPARDYDRLWSGAFRGGAPSHSIAARLAVRAYDRAGVERRRAARQSGSPDPMLRAATRLAQPPGATSTGARSSGAQHVLVKSVQCARSVEWVANRFEPAVIVLERNPLNTLASWQELGFVRNDTETRRLAEYARRRWDVEAPDERDALSTQTFVFAVLMSAIKDAAKRHPEWLVVSHDELCSDAPSRLRALAERVGLGWTDEADEFVRASDRSGSGYATNRRTSEQPERWRRRLSPGDVDTIQRVLDRFPEWSRTAT